MNAIDPVAIGYILERIPNGSIFEKFGQQFIAAQTNSLDFIPVGGTRDGGIDGLEYTWTISGRPNKTIYQFSIQDSPRTKIRNTLERLKQSVPDCKRVYYVTNQIVRDQNELIDNAFDDYGVSLTINDKAWFEAHVNSSPQTINVFRRMEQQHFHAYERSNTIISSFDSKDPRIYVFLRQQIENKSRDYGGKTTVHLDEILMDSLILVALEGTDPEKGILRSREEIQKRILEITDINASWVIEILPRRLKALSDKPTRRIRHHKKVDQYCLPYETRSEITERNIADHALHDHFTKSVGALLEDRLNEEDINIRSFKPVELALDILRELFHKQGLEFAQFVSTGDGGVLIDQSLDEIVRQKIISVGIPPKVRNAIQFILLEVFRQVIYNGDEHQKEYLAKLSNTYNMLFLLQIDPTLARYFEHVAADLRIYVDSSILIPAMAEYFLEPHNQRYTILLRHARDAGISILVNSYVIGEIENHIRNMKTIFLTEYESREDLFNDRMSVIFVEEILIRAYFYAKLNGQITNFREFIEEFVSWRMYGDMRGELILWLEDQFGVQFVENEIKLDPEAVEQLTQALAPLKANDEKRARTDAKQLLTIYELRKENNESSRTGIFGYSTWWLTSDVTSQIAFQRIASAKQNGASPYIRADYIYNYISLAPSKKHVDAIYQKMFPTLLGVNISFYVPSEVASYIRKLFNDYQQIVDKPRFRAKLREFIHYLKSNPNHQDRTKLANFYDELKKEAESYIPPAS